MKDTIIKETGNSRFLRSSVAEDITFAEFIALLRAGRLPIDLAGINEEGIETLGMALSKENLLSEETEMTIWGNAADRTPTNALKAIYEILSETFSAGLAEKAKIITGTYTGNNAATRTISLGFKPKAVILFTPHGGSYESSSSGESVIIATSDLSPLSATNKTLLSITNGGFNVYYAVDIYDEPYVKTNSSVKGKYGYIAVG